MPGLNDLYPNSVGWVLAVGVMGVLIAVVAAFGYQVVARFANIAAPWMVLVFLAFGLIGLRQFIDATILRFVRWAMSGRWPGRRYGKAASLCPVRSSSPFGM
jgi:purine-cytosine permease-like protein